MLPDPRAKGYAWPTDHGSQITDHGSSELHIYIEWLTRLKIRPIRRETDLHNHMICDGASTSRPFQEVVDSRLPLAIAGVHFACGGNGVDGRFDVQRRRFRCPVAPRRQHGHNWQVTNWLVLFFSYHLATVTISDRVTSALQAVRTSLQRKIVIHQFPSRELRPTLFR